MKCPYCKEEILSGAIICKHCKTNLKDPFGKEREKKAEDPLLGYFVPVKVSIWAVLAGYAGLISLIIVPAPLALILGIAAIIDLKKHPEQHGMGRAIFGLLMGIVGTLLLLTMALART
ncbi:DUF4190 domain-containing protein [bacterium]|nr:DUF4190 domain-containing protein [bacterium]